MQELSVIMGRWDDVMAEDVCFFSLEWNCLDDWINGQMVGWMGTSLLAKCVVVLLTGQHR